MALNKACCKIGGVFCITPLYLIYKLLAILPMHFQLWHKLCLAHSCLLCAPPSYPFHLLHLFQGPSGALAFLPLPSVYPQWSALGDFPLPFSYPSFPFNPLWSHSCFVSGDILSSLTLDLCLTLLKLPIIKLTLIHSPSTQTPLPYIIVFGIFKDSTLHISDWAAGPSKHLTFLKALIFVWARLSALAYVLILCTKANLPHYVTSASAVSLFFSQVLQHTFSFFLLQHYSHRITVFKVAKDHMLFGPPLWSDWSKQEALTRYDDSVS